MSHVVRPPENGATASPVLPTSNTIDRPASQSQLQPTEVAGPSRPPRLSRQSTNNSIHAQNSLRRMATHETGHGIDEDHDGNNRLDTHDEHSEHHQDHLVRTGPGGDEETKIGAEEVSEKKPKAPELQDQTNLLPVRQVILVFVGLTCALFCSLIDQTMYVSSLLVKGGADRQYYYCLTYSWTGLQSGGYQPLGWNCLSPYLYRRFASNLIGTGLTSRRCSPSTVDYPISLVEKSSS